MLLKTDIMKDADHNFHSGSYNHSIYDDFGTRAMDKELYIFISQNIMGRPFVIKPYRYPLNYEQLGHLRKNCSRNTRLGHTWVKFHAPKLFKLEFLFECFCCKQLHKHAYLYDTLILGEIDKTVDRSILDVNITNARKLFLVYRWHWHGSTMAMVD